MFNIQYIYGWLLIIINLFIRRASQVVMVNGEVVVGAKRPPLLVSSDGLLVVGSKTSCSSKREVERLRWGTKSPPMLVSWDGMVVVGSQTSHSSKQEVERWWLA
jgi:hypothetical protein